MDRRGYDTIVCSNYLGNPKPPGHYRHCRLNFTPVLGRTIREPLVVRNPGAKSKPKYVNNPKGKSSLVLYYNRKETY